MVDLLAKATLFFCAHDAAIGGGVVEPRQQRGGEHFSGMLELGDLLAGSTLVAREVDGSWSIVPSPNPPHTNYDGLGAVSCYSTKCLATGSAAGATAITTLIESAVGSKWRILASPNDSGPLSALGGLSCVTIGSCMAVGDHDPGNGTRLPLAERYDGTRWVIVPTPNP